MPQMRLKMLFMFFGCALVALSYGCSTPWGSPVAKSETPGIPQMLSEEPLEYHPPAATEPDMTAVLDKLQQIREIDPAAERKLLEQLRQTPSKSWPLVAEQFRASLAYHERLAKASHSGGMVDEAKVGAEGFKTGYDSANESLISKSASSINSRPSAPIGTLVDPRQGDADGVSSEAMAKSTPYSTPSALPRVARNDSAPPDEFIANDAVYPITGKSHASNDNADSSPKSNLDTAVVQTRLETFTGVEVAAHQGKPQPSADDLDWQQLVQRAADDLNQRVAAAPATTAEVHQHVSLRMLWLLAGDTEKAMEPIPHISPAEQDYWSRQLFSLATYLDHHTQPDDKRRAAASVIHLDDAMASLRELGSLTLRNFTFCKNVYGYGSIEPFANDRFPPGQQVSLYVEVENFHSKSTDKGFCTLLGSTYELLDESGTRISGGEFPDVDDCCRSRRRDFHIEYGLALPEKMAPGRYQLQLVVKDRQSDKIGHATAAFEIRGIRSSSSPIPASAGMPAK